MRKTLILTALLAAVVLAIIIQHLDARGGSTQNLKYSGSVSVPVPDNTDTVRTDYYASGAQVGTPTYLWIKFRLKAGSSAVAAKAWVEACPGEGSIYENNWGTIFSSVTDTLWHGKELSFSKGPYRWRVGIAGNSAANDSSTATIMFGI